MCVCVLVWLAVDFVWFSFFMVLCVFWSRRCLVCLSPGFKPPWRKLIVCWIVVIHSFVFLFMFRSFLFRGWRRFFCFLWSGFVFFCSLWFFDLSVDCNDGGGWCWFPWLYRCVDVDFPYVYAYPWPVCHGSGRVCSIQFMFWFDRLIFTLLN